MTLNFSGFTNPRTGQRLPSTVLQVWGRDQNISSTYHHNIRRNNWNSQDCGMVLDSRVKGKECWPIRKHVLCLKCNRRRQDESEPEESDEEWVSSSDLSHNWSRSDAAWVEEEGVELVSCLEVIEIWQQISNLSYFKKTTDIDWQNISRSQLFAPIPFDNNFDLCWISPSHWGPHWLVPN